MQLECGCESIRLLKSTVFCVVMLFILETAQHLTLLFDPDDASEVHGVTTQKTIPFIGSAMRTSNPAL
jgi:hypothetical protein